MYIGMTLYFSLFMFSINCKAVTIETSCSHVTPPKITPRFYSTRYLSIVFYDLINDQTINQIKNAHNDYITNFKHYLDSYHKRDLVMSVSLNDNNIKLWNPYNCQNLLNIKNINKKGGILSACFLNDIDKEQIYIITSNQSLNENEPIKLYDLKGEMVKIIKDSNYSVYFIDTYYDIKNNKKYILACNNSCIRSYDYDQNKIYQIYSKDKRFNITHIYLVINSKEEMMELSQDGSIRIWAFHSADLLKHIKIGGFFEIGCFCLMNEENILIGCRDKSIKTVQLKDGNIISEFNRHNKEVNFITIINHDKLGKILISQGLKDDGIIIWKIYE